ncbi:MAG: response regulator transcription factor [Acidobacteria bacterium]|jgi:DNA-binding NarL/FixJ family response regulator|nr:response regulator transcription factor [Acidobacteriota bacterium]
MTEQIRIVMADDHPIVRQGLRQMIETDKNLSIVAEAGDGQTALELIEKHQPDVTVLDIDMPKMDGFAVVRELQKRRINVEIVFLTMHSEEEIFQAAMDLGVKGYVLKDSAVTDIVSSIKSVAAQRPFLSPALSALLLNRRRRAEDFEREQPGLHLLTPTEKRVLKLIAEDKTSKEIGEELFISYRTVETHRANISRKLDLHGSLALVKFAVAHKSEF